MGSGRRALWDGSSQEEQESGSFAESTERLLMRLEVKCEK